MNSSFIIASGPEPAQFHTELLSIHIGTIHRNRPFCIKKGVTGPKCISVSEDGLLS